MKNSKVIIITAAIVVILIPLLIASFLLFGRTTTVSETTSPKASKAKKEAIKQSASAVFELPKTITYKQAVNPDPKTKIQISSFIKQKIKSLKKVKNSDYVITITKNGKPVMPDAYKKFGPKISFVKTAFASADNVITYELDDSGMPWSPAEKNFINANLPDLYAHVKSTVGNPAFTANYKIIKTDVRGYCDPWSNIISIYSVNPSDRGSLNVLAHEMTHSFNDDYIFNNRAYEEGTAMLAEYLWTQKFPYNNPPHNLFDSLMYQNLNQPMIATPYFYCDSFQGTAEPIWEFQHYYMSGYMMQKIYLTDQNGVINFRKNRNTAIDQYIQNNSTGISPYTETANKSFLKQAVAKVEDEPTDTWMSHQYVATNAFLTPLQYVGYFNGKFYLGVKGAGDNYGNQSTYYYNKTVNVEIHTLTDRVVKEFSAQSGNGSDSLSNDFDQNNSYFKIVMRSSIDGKSVESSFYTFLLYTARTTDLPEYHAVLPNPERASANLIYLKTNAEIPLNLKGDFMYATQILNQGAYRYTKNGTSYYFIANSDPHFTFMGINNFETPPFTVNWLSPRDPNLGNIIDPDISTQYKFDTSGTAYCQNNQLSLVFYFNGRLNPESVTVNDQKAFVYNYNKVTQYVQLKSGENLFTVKATDLDGNPITSQRKIILGTKPGVYSKVNRIYGADRYEAATKVSQARTQYGQRRDIVLVNGESWTNMVQAALLSKANNASMLYTKTDSIPTTTMNEIVRLRPQKVYIVGSTSSVNVTVENAIKQYFTTNTNILNPSSAIARIYGKDRYVTNLKIIDLIFPTAAQTSPTSADPMPSGGLGYNVTADKIMVVSGKSSTEASLAATIAASRNIPLFFVGDTVPTALKNKVLALHSTKTIIVGDTDSISAAIAKKFPNPTRISGTSKYSLAVNLAKYSKNNLGSKYKTVGLASGTSYPDIIAGSTYLADENGVMLLTSASSLPTVTSNFIKTYKPSVNILHVFGKSTSISATVYNKVKNLLAVQSVLGAQDDQSILGKILESFRVVKPVY